MLFEQAYCRGTVQEDPMSSDVTVNITLTDVVDNNEIRYVAAAPADYRYNFSGSALPFANPSQAFENTPNKGKITMSGNTFQVKLLYPNSYYIGLGTVMVPPMLSLHYKSNGEEKTLNIKIAESIPYRYLNHPESRVSPMFYHGTDELEVRTQEQILRESSYPSTNTMPSNYWGLKPRC